MESQLGSYRGVAELANRFFENWTRPFCRRCLEVTRCGHPGDPRADVDLVQGVFPGCCHSGAADVTCTAAGGDEAWPESLVAALQARRRDPGVPPPVPPAYQLRERHGGRRMNGVACGHQGREGCRLGPWKGPLCLTYLCDPLSLLFARHAGTDPTDPLGLSAAVRGVVRGAGDAVLSELNDRLVRIGEELQRAGFRNGEDLVEHWVSTHFLAGTQGVPGSRI